ncbi:MAG: type II secretion system F family protein [Acidobacteriaceae bacterium]|jgi:tight adherence protein C|nr:type II secretion system F family protein [Acidobacteriaceae bacterium]
MPIPLLFATAGVFVVTAVLVGMLTSWWFAYNSPEQRRLRGMTAAGEAPLVLPVRALAADTTTVDPFLARLSKLMPKSPKEMGRIQKRLTRAGYPRPAAVVYFLSAQIILPVVLGLLTLLVVGIRDGWIYALVAAAIGYVAPGVFLNRQTTQRKKRITNGLADALDLLVVCVEAGSGLDQAVVKASEEMNIVHPDIAYELRLVTTEMRAGKPRIEAFKNFADRTGVEDVRSFVAMLVQTDRFGTSISQALRTQADTIRTKRRQRAEERAGKVSVKLVFPLALCLFPALYVICFGPVVVRIWRVLLEGNGI